MPHLLPLLTAALLLILSSGIQAQGTPISGQVNDYARITAINNNGNCQSTLTLDDASAFQAGDQAIVIQMQGATIDASNSSNFGDITQIGAAGLFEAVTLTAVSGNDISTEFALIHDYDPNGQLQLVRMPSYADAIVTDSLRPKAWDGSTGGVIALKLSGTLQLQAPIDASAAGFRGGTTSNPSSNCFALSSINDYHYPLGAWESEGKGEGVAETITGKEYGRGPQANGGGGGNDHNAGGGGGAGYAPGGSGGENDDPGLFNCRGNFPGLGGKAIAHSDFRLFLGGGGGAGHENNSQSPQGGSGGGIIIIQAAAIKGNGWTISANGESLTINGGLDGGSGGGGAGAILLDVPQVNNAPLEARGGKGCDTQNSNLDRCMGTGGGGGGGVIYANASVTASVAGGAPGIIVNSTSACNGGDANAQSGGAGAVLPLPAFPANPGPSSDTIAQSICEGDGFSLTVNGTVYDENNPTGMEVLQNQYGCDSVIVVDLEVSPMSADTIAQSICEGDGFSLTVNGTVYDEDNPTGMEVLQNQHGCDSVIVVDLQVNGPGMRTDTVSGLFCIDEEIVIHGQLYDKDHPSGTEIISGAAQNGCDSIIIIDLIFLAELSLTDSIYGDTATLVVSDGTPPFSYQWTGGLSGPTNALPTTGTYSVTVTDFFGCTAEHTFSFTHTSSGNFARNQGLSIYPNPTSGTLRMRLERKVESAIQMEIYDPLGRRVKTAEWDGQAPLSIDMRKWPKGVYYLRLQHALGRHTERILLE